jgi:hypothetical protein
MEWMIYTVLILLLLIVVWEWLYGQLLYEGYESNIPAYFGKFFPQRSDVVPGQLEEQDGYVRNKRYSEAYADIQGLGYKADFCRVVERPEDPGSRRVVCALAGQEGLDTFAYSSKTARSGVRFSRDDYYRDVNGDKRDDYCRILKVKQAPLDAWEARCIPAGLLEFKSEFEITDTKPPPDIADLLLFFEGIMVWYRFIDDMVDYAENSKLALAGGIEMDDVELPRDPPPHVEGLEINKLPPLLDEKPPAEQFIRIGENDKLEWDSKVRLRDLRAVSVWVYFDEFTQNAPIFDFGNGAGKDNVRLAIEGKGNQATKLRGVMKPRPDEFAKVCNAKAAIEVSPKLYLATSDANVDEYECKGPEPVESTYPEADAAPIRAANRSSTRPFRIGEDAAEEAGLPSANLIFEIWDTQQRKMRIRAMNAIPLKQWCHVVVTTTDATSFRPTWHVYIDNRKVLEELDGHMPLNSYTTLNYIGKSNWEDVGVGQYDDQDERFRGSLFDFRLYRFPMSASKISKTYEWGHARLI